MTNNTSTIRLWIQGVIVLEIIIMIMIGIEWGLCAQDDDLCQFWITNTLNRPKSFWTLPPLDTSNTNILQQCIQVDNHPIQQGKDITNNNNNTNHHRYQMNWILQLEDPSDYSKWYTAWNDWSLQTSFSHWPLWKHPPTSSVILSDSNLSQYYVYSNTKDLDDDSSKCQIKISPNSMKAMLSKHRHNHQQQQHDELEIILHVVSSHYDKSMDNINNKPLLLCFHPEGQDPEQITEALTINSKQLFILLQGNSNATVSIHQSMEFLIPFLQQQTYPLDIRNVHQVQTWLQAIFQSLLCSNWERFHSIRHMAMRQRHCYWSLFCSSSTTTPPRHVMDSWDQARNYMMQAWQSYSEKNLIIAISKLELTENVLKVIEADDMWMPPLYLQWDHTLAIFLPLIFPLLIPTVLGLIREFKKYKGNTPI